MTTITAETILRSRNTSKPDKVLSTLLLRYPRFIHAEFMTHRQFSRNAASSRAIPVMKMLRSILNDMAIPIYWGANQPGMQASREVSNWKKWIAKALWKSAGYTAVSFAWLMTKLGLHKQIANRITEPWQHITVLVSSTEWSNFLALRDHPDAEPHIAMLARAIRQELYREDNIEDLRPGQWHLPFITAQDFDDDLWAPDEVLMTHTRVLKKSVACCASTSYKTVDGFEMTFDKAVEIHDKLVGSAPIHASPAEHVAQADYWHKGPLGSGIWEQTEEHGNFVGFRQYRKMLLNECL